jgi:tRNA(Ile)-lysidine synthase
MRRARDFLEVETARFLHLHCHIHEAGYAVLSQLPENEEMALRVLAELVMCIGGHALRPRLDDLERLLHALRQPAFKGATLAGCLFAQHKGDTLILRETKAVEPPVALAKGKETLWDNRFLVTVTALPKGLWVGALTQPNWLDIARARKLCNPFPTKKILYTLPALYNAKGALLGVPHLHLWMGKPFECTVVFRQRPLLDAAQT